jgi:hypothetical protein
MPLMEMYTITAAPIRLALQSSVAAIRGVIDRAWLNLSGNGGHHRDNRCRCGAVTWGNYNARIVRPAHGTQAQFRRGFWRDVEFVLRELEALT